MAEIKLVYSDLTNVAKYARETADRYDSYESELKTKLSDKQYSLPATVTGNGNTNVNTACYYVTAKRNDLTAKSKKYRTFATAVDTLITNAKAADTAVAKSVNDSRKTFLDEHKGLSDGGWNAFFANLVVDVPVLGWIVQAVDSVAKGIDTLKTNLRYWYEVCGGKKIIDTVFAIGEVVLAAVGLAIAVVGLATFSGLFAGIVAVAGAIAAVIAMADALVNVYQQFKSNKQDDPAWAKYYGGIDKASDALRKTTFKEKWMNKASGVIAISMDVVEVVCSVISIADGLKNIGETFYKRTGLNKLFSSKKTINVGGETKKVWKFDFNKFKTTVLSREGRSKIGKTLKHSWKSVLFGDSGGIKGLWKKHQRGLNPYVVVKADDDVFTKNVFVKIFNFDVAKVTNFKKFEKKWKVINTDLKIINNVAKNTNELGNMFMYGANFSTTQGVAKRIYGDLGGGGLTGDINGSIGDTVDFVKNVKELLGA